MTCGLLDLGGAPQVSRCHMQCQPHCSHIPWDVQFGGRAPSLQHFVTNKYAKIFQNSAWMCSLVFGYPGGKHWKTLQTSPNFIADMFSIWMWGALMRVKPVIELPPLIWSLIVPSFGAWLVATYISFQLIFMCAFLLGPLGMIFLGLRGWMPIYTPYSLSGFL